jgi:putative nucleotidyltransferase with HDIG domain
MHPDQLKKIIFGISGTYKGLRLYPAAHPAIKQQASNLAQEFLVLFREKHLLKMGLLEGTLFFENHLFVSSEPAVEEISNLLKERELQGFEFQVGLTAEELLRFFQLFSEKRRVGQELAQSMGSRGIDHIRLITVESGDEEEDVQIPRKIYQRALKAVSHIFNDVRLGKVPSSKEAISVVKSMVQSTLSDPHALMALSMLKDYDNYTFTHSVNVSVIALVVGQASGLSEEKLRVLGLGALLHDIGKLIIDKDIITKPGRLTAQEYEEIKKHPYSGSEIVGKMDGVTEEVIDIILGHHLNYDRSGYPADARGRNLSILVDMATIADTYDAMTTLRSYQRPATPRIATEMLKKLAGTALHPQLLENLIKSLGPYPVGSLVRLDSNEIGVVTRVGSREKDAVELKIIFTSSGEKLEEPIPVVLEGNEAERIVAEVDPFVKGIEVTDYFE